MKQRIVLALLACSLCSAAAAQTQLQFPDISGAAQRGYEQGQANRMRRIQMQQAQQDLQQQQAYQAQQEQEAQDQQELKRLAGVLLSAQTDDERWAALNQMAALDPALAVQYMQAMHLDKAK